MAPTEIVDSHRFAVLAAALEDICVIAGIEAHTRDYHDAAQLLAHLYKNGYRTPEQLRSALDPARLEARFG
jgi:hypothetical protein